VRFAVLFLVVFMAWPAVAEPAGWLRPDGSYQTKQPPLKPSAFEWPHRGDRTMTQEEWEARTRDFRARQEAREAAMGRLSSVIPPGWNADAFAAWLDSLPESENVEDRRTAPPPTRGHSVSQSIGEWPEYKEPAPKQEEAPKKRVPKTKEEWAEFHRTMDMFAKMYGR
jgi:hypothetical protein